MRQGAMKGLVGGATLLLVATAGAAPQGGTTPATPAPTRHAEPANDVPYDPAGRRDPFRPPRVNSNTASGEARTPLQRYEIGQLKLVAVIYQANEPRAVVEDETGLGYIVRVGTPIGPNGGEVKSIEKGKVHVKEESIDFYGDRQTSEVVMELASDERGKR
jgi:type IV pilus assembly protein PilP